MSRLKRALSRVSAPVEEMPVVPANTLLAGLAPRDLELLAPELERIRLHRDQVLAVPGDAMPWVYFPEGAAMVWLFMVMADGRTAMAGAATRNDATGLLEAVGNGRSLGRAVVAMSGSALRIRAAGLGAAARRSAGLRSVLGHHGREITGQAMQFAACNALHSAKQRLCRWILAMHDCVCDGAGDVEAAETALPLTQEALGSVLGVQRTTVTVLATQLQREGLVRYARGRMFVLDRPGLERAACECHGVVRRRQANPAADAGAG